MFDTPDVRVYVDALTHHTVNDRERNQVKAVDVTLRIEPIEPGLAAEIDDSVRGMLFRRGTAEVNPNAKKIVFAFAPRPQRLTFKADPDLKRPSFVVDEAKISGLTAAKPKDGQHWVFTFKATVANLGGDELAWLQHALYSHQYLTTEKATPGLFDEEEEQGRRRRRAAADSDGEQAATQ